MDPVTAPIYSLERDSKPLHREGESKQGTAVCQGWGTRHINPWRPKWPEFMEQNVKKERATKIEDSRDRKTHIHTSNLQLSTYQWMYVLDQDWNHPKKIRGRNSWGSQRARNCSFLLARVKSIPVNHYRAITWYFLKVRQN